MIYFKLKVFPQISETFIVSNLVYAKQKGFSIKIYTDKYLGLENSSQATLLHKNKIEADVIKPIALSQSYCKKILQAAKMLLNLRVLLAIIPYYKLKRKKNFSPLISLYQYKALKSNLIHVHFNNALSTLLDLKKIRFINPKCIVTYHGYDAFLNDKEDFQRIYGDFYRSNVVAVTTNSNYLKQQVVNLGVEPSKIEVIPIGINFNKFKGSAKQLNNHKTIQLLTVGRLVQLKGQIYVIRAVRDIVNQGYKVKYTMIGDGNYRNVLEEEVNKLNLFQYINFEGAKSQDEIISYLQDSDVFMMPSTYDNATGRREAFGLVSLEAQAAGLPVIGFKSGGFPDTIIEGKTGFAVEDRNHHALVQKIKRLIEHKDFYHQMSSAAINHASQYDFKYTTQKYLDLYKKHGSSI
ncbi:glycosyltransferase family 4 protein [Psychroflexus sp. ALD_RP9]|uniref:glycosyltransferase family 4 protein n=1 Tax=Psychroflexus sp. ALD_RP9 TaxID=2777186 RepID=UPI001A8CED70|nr:glycosyltransferase family 4 protein [Psychroflexus sp. ALD_RP9]QSS96390.1 glycosyltransferase family 4 protein [Psychroflexus sp. ALD_RP9]